MNQHLQFDVLTLFPDIIHGYSSEAIIGRAQNNKLISVKAHNFREFSGNKWGHVDDTPYGGGPGMVLRVEPIYECLKSIDAIKKTKKQESKKTRVIVMDPAGKKFDQRMAEKFSKLDRLVLICGRYEGFDARLYDFVDERISVGDFVLAGGELAALSVIEATSRLIPGVLGNAESLVNESHNLELETHNSTSSGLRVVSSKKEYPQYTKPENFMGLKVPPVLLTGDHKKIEEWRKKNSK